MATFGSFVAGQVLTAAELNSGGTWSTYTPTFTQSATITKTTNWARYMEFNKFVVVSLKLTASSAGTANNIIKIGLPVAASANNFIMGTMTRILASTSPRLVLHYAVYDSSTAVRFTVRTADGNVGASAFFHGETSCDGITIASGDIYHCQFMYEAA